MKNGYGVSARKTLFSMLGSESRSLLTEAGFSPRALSPSSMERLEVFFRRAIRENGLSHLAWQRWLSGEFITKVHLIIRELEGRLFQEVVTREFTKRTPDIFLANPTLTTSIISPLIAEKSPYEFSIPDHLVFFKEGDRAKLAGFVEDKKSIFAAEDDRLIEQLENEWNLWLLLSKNLKVQSRFRQRVFAAIPTFPHKVNIAPVSEGQIWLTTTRNAGADYNQLLPWIREFRSSASRQSIELLAAILVKNRFLPRLEQLKN